LNCRDTRQIEKVYESARLTRRDLLSGVDGLWDMVEAHEQHCSYEELKSLVGEGGRDGRPKQEEAILEIIRYDAHVRRLTSEKGGMDGQMLDFIFGRPWLTPSRCLILRWSKRGGAYRLIFRQPISKR
jgi:hypothetical protein